MGLGFFFSSNHIDNVHISSVFEHDNMYIKVSCVPETIHGCWHYNMCLVYQNLNHHFLFQFVLFLVTVDQWLATLKQALFVPWLLVGFFSIMFMHNSMAYSTFLKLLNGFSDQNQGLLTEREILFRVELHWIFTQPRLLGSFFYRFSLKLSDVLWHRS